MTYQVEPIGFIESPFKDKFGTPRQSMIARHTESCLRWDKKIVREGMFHGLTVGQFVWVLFYFHRLSHKKVLEKVHPPRLRGKTMGVFATRSPHRPNPMGLSLGRISRIEKQALYFTGLDLVDGTPVFDIKPYLKNFDQPKGRIQHWIDETPFSRLKVKWEPQLWKSLTCEQQKILKTPLKEILQEDPRPLAYLQKEDFQYHIKYGDYDIGFKIENQQVTINKIKQLKS